jgi:hypothetical protein
MLEFYRAKELIDLGEKSTLSKIPQIKRDLHNIQLIE